MNCDSCNIRKKKDPFAWAGGAIPAMSRSSAPSEAAGNTVGRELLSLSATPNHSTGTWLMSVRERLASRRGESFTTRGEKGSSFRGRRPWQSTGSTRPTRSSSTTNADRCYNVLSVSVGRCAVASLVHGTHEDPEHTRVAANMEHTRESPTNQATGSMRRDRAG